MSVEITTIGQNTVEVITTGNSMTVEVMGLFPAYINPATGLPYVLPFVIGGGGSGDMSKSIYDTDNDGKVDLSEDAEKLGAVAANLYALKTYADNVSINGGYF